MRGVVTHSELVQVRLEHLIQVRQLRTLGQRDQLGIELLDPPFDELPFRRDRMGLPGRPILGEQGSSSG